MCKAKRVYGLAFFMQKSLYFVENYDIIMLKNVE